MGGCLGKEAEHAGISGWKEVQFLVRVLLGFVSLSACL